MSEHDLDELVALSRRLGGDPSLVLVGGGNTSVKTDTQIIIKASGRCLDGITHQDFARLHRHKVRAVLEEKGLSTDPAQREARVKELLLEARVDPVHGLRASVETSLHELIPLRFVIHTHPTAVNGLTCSVRGKEAAQELFGDTVLWVGYTDPGYMLARKIERALGRYRSTHGRPPQAMLLQNHGIFVGGDTAQEAERLHQSFVDRIAQAIRRGLPKVPFGGAKLRPSEAAVVRVVQIVAPALRGLLRPSWGSCIVRCRTSEPLSDFVSSNQGRALALQGALIPDEVAYCRARPLWLPCDPDAVSQDQLVRRLEGQLARYRRAHGFDPQIVLVEGVGMFAAGRDARSANHAALMYEDGVRTRQYAEAFGGVRALSKRAQHFIESWEVERYRLKVVESSETGARYEHRIALVTGAAQGLGREIALGLAEQGMCVVVADLEEAGARETVDAIQALHGADRAVWVQADVCRADHVARMVRCAVETFGGIDVLISNAGILKAHKITQFPEDLWRKIIEVNLVGFFLCAKAAAQVMQVQKSGDIIQINSKSGKKGSKYNSAYATSKFGGIGLTQSIALDLVEDGIRVNAICPGNLFDLPLWSGEGGLFEQYKAKLGARTREEVRAHYEGRIPMGRGCRGSDVLKAVFYILDQEYETGQAYNVTGGEEMR